MSDPDHLEGTGLNENSAIFKHQRKENIACDQLISLQILQLYGLVLVGYGVQVEA
jgi:hypothetical protein